jgi:hypothetical protein
MLESSNRISNQPTGFEASRADDRAGRRQPLPTPRQVNTNKGYLEIRNLTVLQTVSYFASQYLTNPAEKPIAP